MGNEKAVDRLVSDAAGPAAKALGTELAPAGKEIGQVTTAAVHLLLAPIWAVVWSGEKIRGWVEDKVQSRLAKIPAENLQEPDLQVVGPALEAMRYIDEESELSDMFAELLASSMNKSQSAHPAYVEILKQISSDEARIIRFLAYHGDLAGYELRIEYGPLGVGGYTVYDRFYSEMETKIKLDRPHNVPAYIDNLERLGMIHLPESGYIKDPEKYKALDSLDRVQQHMIIDSDDIRPTKRQRMLLITSFGRSLMFSCIPRAS